MILIKPAYDADASAYFTTAGVTNTAGRQQISRFVTGIKDLGLWNNMVCWPLRSSQNAGTGTTAYSLGGLGTYNGTLTNGPTWGSNGIVFDGIDDLISISSSISTNNLGSIFYCGIHATMSESQKAINVNRIEIGKAEEASFGIEAGVLVSPFPNVGRSTTISGLGEGIFYTASAVFNPASSTIARFYNGGLKQNNSSATYGTFELENAVYIGARRPSNSNFNGTIAFAAYFNSALTDANCLNLYNQYKSTLGQELGLP